MAVGTRITYNSNSKVSKLKKTADSYIPTVVLAIELTDSEQDWAVPNADAST